MEGRTRILIIAFSDSIHTARWIAQIDTLKFEVHLFPSVPFRSIHPEIKNVIIHLLGKPSNWEANKSVRAEYPWPSLKTISSFFGIAVFKELIFKSGVNRIQKKALLKTIDKIRPDIVHTLETQKAGYLYNSVSPFPYSGTPWLHSNWGIDLHFYKDIPVHQAKLRKLLSKISLLIVEGERDKLLAEELNYRGGTIIIPSVGGGLDFEQFDKLGNVRPPSRRKMILLKGYEGDERLASTVLLALEKLFPLLAGYEVIVYSCSKKLAGLIGKIRNQNKLLISPYSEMPREEMLRWTYNSRISITNNLSDGVPNTMLEAMAFGTFPIQSNTAITEGWIEDGKNGLLTNPRDIDQIAFAISRALKEDDLVDNAALYNMRMVRERLSMNKIRSQINDLYETA